MPRSIAAVLTGFVAIAVLSFGASALLRTLAPAAFDAAGRATDPGVLVLSLAYVGVFAVAGCYLTARLAPGRPMGHALALGALGLAFNIVGSIVMWDTAPAWYHLTALVLVMPYAWLGGHFRVRELERAGASAPAAALS